MLPKYGDSRFPKKDILLSVCRSLTTCFFLTELAEIVTILAAIIDFIFNLLLEFPGEVNNMLGVRVCAVHMDGFLARNSLNKGPCFQQIFLRHCRVRLSFAKK